MSSPNIAAILHALQPVAAAKLGFLLKEASDLLLKPGSTFSIFSLLSALLIAAGFIAYRRRSRGRRLRFKLIVRALFPRWLLRSASTKADLGFFLLNVFVLGGLIGWALISYATVSRWTDARLTNLFGRGGWISMDHRLAAACLTVITFLVYELAYWIDHYLSHEVPFLWEFHRVHHTAETLTPVTVFRVHPVDTLVFYNIVALMTGATQGAALYLLGWPVSGMTLFGGDIILLAFVFVTIHLQHSHIWIAFTGGWGRIFASPAHHQIHHSTNPAHFGKNLGSCLALFDWMFGTLRIPTRVREPLVYGVEPGGESPHTITGGLITPFIRAFAKTGEGLSGLTGWGPLSSGPAKGADNAAQDDDRLRA